MIEQQNELEGLKDQIKSLTEYIVDNNIHHNSNITLTDYDIIDIKEID